MKHFTRKFTLCISLALVLATFFSLPAQAAMTELVVSKIQQTKSNWCWAAAAEMAGKYKYSSSTRTQSDVVAYSRSHDDSQTVISTASCVFTLYQNGSYNNSNTVTISCTKNGTTSVVSN